MVTIEAPRSDELDPTHLGQFQETRCPDNVFRKANGILQSDSGASNSTLLSMPALANNNEADVSMGIRNLREKRPALGHNPAQFSLRPSITQPSAGLEFNLNIDQMHDPVDFFSAYDKLQYAKDEIQRQTGGSITNINDFMPSANPCCRRPGILGKSVRFKHHYSSAISENDDTLLSSQEPIQEDNMCSSEFVLQRETANSDIGLQRKEIAESTSKTENRINEILDKLLLESIENLDGDGALSLMQEGLQIKPDVRDKYLPEFSGTRRTDIMDLEKEFHKNRKSLTDIPKLMRGLSSKTHVKSLHAAENQVHILASPTTPKSPFAGLCLLNKHISQSKPISDPFMACDIELPSARNASSQEDFNRLSQQLDDGKELTISDKLKSPTEVKATRTTVTGTTWKHLIEGVTPNLLEKSVNDKFVNVNSSSVSIDIRSSGSNDFVVYHDGDNSMTDSAIANADTHLCTNGANRMAEHLSYLLGQNSLQEAISCPQPFISIGKSTRSHTNAVALSHGLCGMDNNVEDMHPGTTSFMQPNVNTCNSKTKNINVSHSPSDQSDSTFTKGLLKNGQPIAADSTFRKDLKQLNKALKKGSAKELSKARTHEHKRRKAITRQNLLETGTHWESGVRRSKRIRTRPLEYWKGERFLYGRVHESLATVIGIKCIDPAEHSGEPTFRVSSYVSDKHKELVELAARH